jgi:hypothetical protein
VVVVVVEGGWPSTRQSPGYVQHNRRTMAVVVARPARRRQSGAEKKNQTNYLIERSELSPYSIGVASPVVVTCSAAPLLPRLLVADTCCTVRGIQRQNERYDPLGPVGAS